MYPRRTHSDLEFGDSPPRSDAWIFPRYNRDRGRAAMMQEVHNVLGVTEETSGAEFLGVGREQLEGVPLTPPAEPADTERIHGYGAVSP